MRFIPRVLLFSACAWLAACSTQEVYTGESFASDSPFKMRVEGDVAPACESARRSLLGQGYLIESASEEGIKARKATRGGETQNTFIEMTIVCLPDSKGSTLFATGVLTTYDLKKSSSSASVGVSAFGSISLPIGQSADSLVKVSEQTIDDKDFYGRFFMAVSNTLDEMNAGKAPPEVPVEPAVPATPLTPAAPEQVAQPAVPGVSAPGASTPPATAPAPVATPAPAVVPPVLATTPAPLTAPASTAVVPTSPAGSEALTPEPEPVLSEQAPTYTLQPEAPLAAPPVSLDPNPTTEPPPANVEEPAVNEGVPATAPEPSANEQAPTSSAPVAGAGEPAVEPAPEPESKAPADAEPAADSNLLFL